MRVEDAWRLRLGAYAREQTWLVRVGPHEGPTRREPRDRNIGTETEIIIELGVADRKQAHVVSSAGLSGEHLPEDTLDPAVTADDLRQVGDPHTPSSFT